MALAFAVLLTVPLEAQKLPYSYFDSLTYTLYTDAEWKALTEAGIKAISHGHDGYYMQIRTGIALFNRGRYRSAGKYLVRAWEVSPNEVSGEYAYLSMLWGGSYLQSETIREKLPGGVLKRLALPDSPAVKSAGVSWATFFPENEIVAGGIESDFEKSGSRISANRFSHYSASLTHKLGTQGILTHQAGVLKKESEFYIGPTEQTDLLWMDDYQTNQFNYYMRWDGSLGQNWGMSLFGNGLWFNFPIYTAVSTGTGNNPSRWLQSKVNDFDFVAGATVIKSLGLADLSLEVAGSSIGNENQLQVTGRVLFYPFYNLNFYLGGELIFNHSASEKQLLGSGTIGGRLSRFLWIEASGTLADEASYFHGQQGSLVFNGPELMDHMAGITAIVLPVKRIKWYIMYQQRGYTSYFIPDDFTGQPERALNKKYQLISTSLLWTF